MNKNEKEVSDKMIMKIFKLISKLDIESFIWKEEDLVKLLKLLKVDSFSKVKKITLKKISTFNHNEIKSIC